MNENRGRGVSWFIRMVLDKASADRVRREGHEALSKGTDPKQAKRNLKDVEQSTTALGSAFKRLGGIIASVFAVQQISAFVRDTFRAVDQLEASTRKLSGTSKLTGVSLTFLKDASKEVQDQFKLAIPLANDLTAEVTKLTQKAGDIQQTSSAMRAFLDLGAARGLSAEKTLTAIGQAILGIDEGTDKLFNKNPSVIYQEYANSIGIAAGKLTDQQKALALLDATLTAGQQTRGEYLRYLDSEAGKADLAAQKTEAMKAVIGEALAPVRVLAYDGMAELATEIGGAAEEIELLSDALVRLAGVLSVPGKIRGWFVDLEDRLGTNRVGKQIDEMNRLAREEARNRGQPTTTVDSQFFPQRNAQRSASDDAARARLQEAELERTRAAAAIAAEAESAAKTAADRARSILQQFDRARLEEIGLAGGNLSEAARQKFLADEARRGDFADRGGRLSPVDSLRPDPLLWVEEAKGFEGFYLNMLDNVEAASERAAATIADAFGSTFQFMLDEGATVGNFLVGLGRNTAAAVLGGIADLASGKAAENIAMAIEFGARALGFGSLGNFPSATAAGASASQHLAAAAAWGALAGGAATAGGAAGTGYRGTGSSYDRGLDRSERTEVGTGPVTINIDPFDPDNPVHVKQVGKAVDLDIRLGGRRAR